MKILPASVLALSSILSLYSSSSTQQAKKPQMPDFFQTHEKLPGKGAKYCAPTVVSNILVYLDTNGFPNMLKAEIPNEEDQLELIKLLGSKEYMATASFGTNPPMVMSGLEKYVKEKDYKINIKYKGFEGGKYLTDKESPSPKWLKEECDKGSHAVMRFGFYYPDEKEKGLFVRWGGHYVTVVEPKNESEVYIHDPLPSDKDDKSPKKELYKFTKFPEASLLRDRDLPKETISSKGLWSIDPASVPHIKSTMILEGIIAFKVEQKDK